MLPKIPLTLKRYGGYFGISFPVIFINCRGFEVGFTFHVVVSTAEVSRCCFWPCCHRGLSWAAGTVASSVLLISIIQARWMEADRSMAGSSDGVKPTTFFHGLQLRKEATRCGRLLIGPDARRLTLDSRP